jgi:hypothetical protein
MRSGHSAARLVWKRARRWATVSLTGEKNWDLIGSFNVEVQCSYSCVAGSCSCLVQKAEAAGRCGWHTQVGLSDTFHDYSWKYPDDVTLLSRRYIFVWHYLNKKMQKGKVIPVTGRGGAQGCETFSRQSAHRWRWCQTNTPAAIYPQEDSWYSFLLEAESTSGPQCDWKD